MLADFLPEAIALGALIAGESDAALLLAVMIGLQNLPEGFNAYRALRERGHIRRENILRAFVAIALLGPGCGLAGVLWLSQAPAMVGVLLLFAAGGILYLVFQDIAPQAPLQNHWAPPLGAVAGFMAGLLGHLLIGHA